MSHNQVHITKMVTKREAKQRQAMAAVAGKAVKEKEHRDTMSTTILTQWEIIIYIEGIRQYLDS